MVLATGLLALTAFAQIKEHPWEGTLCHVSKPNAELVCVPTNQEVIAFEHDGETPFVWRSVRADTLLFSVAEPTKPVALSLKPSVTLSIVQWRSDPAEVEVTLQRQATTWTTRVAASDVGKIRAFALSAGWGGDPRPPDQVAAAPPREISPSAILPVSF